MHSHVCWEGRQCELHCPGFEETRQKTCTVRCRGRNLAGHTDKAYVRGLGRRAYPSRRGDSAARGRADVVRAFFGSWHASCQCKNATCPMRWSSSRARSWKAAHQKACDPNR
eukprot:scaffold80054_cov60-Phaeocystis_antarctica.AAC.1